MSHGGAIGEWSGVNVDQCASPDRVPGAPRTATPADDDRPTFQDELRRATPLLVAIPVLIVVWWGVGVLVIHSRIAGWDVSAERRLAAHRTPWLNVATEWATWLAEAAPVIALTLIAVVLARRFTGRWRAPLFIALAVGGEKLIYLAASQLVRRGRPPVPTIGVSYSTASFPSGHVGSAICLYGAIAIVIGAWAGRRVAIAGLAAAVLIAAVVGGSRMYDGFHFPSDVAAGAVNGTVWLVFTWLVLRPLRPDDGVPAP
jgi:membrane-associated phospholipid phosphatase